MDIEKYKREAENAIPTTKKLFDRLKKIKPKDLDVVIHELHDKAFDKIDCRECANCCKTTSPIFYQKDIERVSKKLRMTPGDFAQTYLTIDEDRDYVLKSTPCPFLDEDNSCKVYDARPSACAEYPHTNRKKMYQILDLTYKNIFVCPAVHEIVEGMKKKF